MGSNNKFKRFLTKENADASLQIKYKYKTQTLNYFWKNLRYKIEGKMNQKKLIKMPMN